MLDTKQEVQVTSLHVALSDIQATAQDLYERGFNVFPLPTAHDWILRVENGNVTKKPYPVRMQKVYASRLYFDGSFTELFDRSNIGVMCGRTSGNLVAIDCDSQKSFEYVGRELTARAIPFWCFTTHRGGVYLLRLAEGEAVNITKKTGIHADVEIWGNSHYIVMPPSVHPSGDVYQWKSPEPRFHLPPRDTIPPVNVGAVEWLGVTVKKSGETRIPMPKYSLPSWAENISRANIETWTNGAAEGSRNAQLTKLAYDLAGNGIAQSTAKNVLLEAAGRCTPPYPEREAKAIIKSAYKGTRTPARSYYGENVTRAKTWQSAAEFAESFDWNSQAWTYSKKVKGQLITNCLKAYAVKRVFLALIERAKLDGRPTFRATVREVSILADLQKMTVSRAMQALDRAGIVGRAKSKDCNLFSFADYSRSDTLTLNCRDSVSLLEYPKLPTKHAERDVFGAGHLYTVWRYLLVKPERTPYRVAKALHISPSVAYSAVRRLQGMTTPDGKALVTYSQAEGQYYGEACTDTTLQLVAAEYGRDGRSAAREAKYQQERMRFLNNEFSRAKVRYSLETQRLKDGKR